MTQAFTRNRRTYGLDDKGEIQVPKHKDESTDARHRDGKIRSSNEVSVMETERRDFVILTFEIGQPVMGGTTGKRKPCNFTAG